MISSFRNFAKTKIAGVFIFIIIIPFVFWGMGSMFNSGNTNNIAKINNTNISTQDFMNYLNNSGVSQQVIRDNLENNVIEELLSGLISTTLLDLEIKDFEVHLTQQTLLKRIKSNKNFLDENNFNYLWCDIPLIGYHQNDAHPNELGYMVLKECSSRAIVNLLN